MKRIVVLTTIAFALAFVFSCAQKEDKGEAAKTSEAVSGEKVKVDFHIMSKCPFGVKVLQAISPVLDKMGNRVDLNVH